MSSNSPLISVIIPCYNAEKFVENAVRSIIRQSYQNLEILVIDDCSIDKTSEILQSLEKEDQRIIYIRNEINLKLAKTLNKAISLSKGEYIARMDSDDISFPDRLEKQLIFLLQNPEIDIVGANIQHINEYGHILKYRSYMPTTHNDIMVKSAWKSVMNHPSILAKASFFIDLDGFNEYLPYAEDYELWIRALQKGKKFANLSEILLYYRIHQNQMTTSCYNPKNAKIIRGFLFKSFLSTKNPSFLFGCLVQTKIAYTLIQLTSKIRQRFKK